MTGARDTIELQAAGLRHIGHFEAASGPDGLRLVPDLALQVPAPTDGGRTYSFRLRPGIRYSDGLLVKAGDFRYALERLFALGSPGASFYSGLVGAGACEAHPGNCDLSPGVVTNNEAGLVVFHLSAPRSRLLGKAHPVGLRPRPCRRARPITTWG